MDEKNSPANQAYTDNVKAFSEEVSSIVGKLADGTDRRSGPLHLGSALKSITAGVQQ